MKVDPLKITVGELTKGYRDDGEGGVVGYNGKLDIRPPYQREYVYKGKKRDSVIDTALKGFPLNVMYWAVRGDGNFEIIDGQQRTIALCQYVKGDFSVKYDNRQKEFHSLSADIGEKLLDYELTIYVCAGIAATGVFLSSTSVTLAFAILSSLIAFAFALIVSIRFFLSISVNIIYSFL